MSDLDRLSPTALSHRLSGIGVNLLCREVMPLAAFLRDLFGMTLHQQSADFALAYHNGMMLQLHSDASFATHPLSAHLTGGDLRGVGVQIFVFDSDPDRIAAEAESFGGVVIEPPTDKAHGLREATVLGPEGYAFTAARARLSID